MAAAPETLVVAYVSEAWTSSTPGVRPSEDPNRTEVLLVNLMSAECQALQVVPIQRGGQGVTLGEAELKFIDEKTQFQGRFARPRQAPQH